LYKFFFGGGELKFVTKKTVRGREHKKDVVTGQQNNK